MDSKKLILIGLTLMLLGSVDAWWNFSFIERFEITNSSFQGIGFITNTSSYGTVKGINEETLFLYNDTSNDLLAVANETNEYCYFQTNPSVLKCPNPPSNLMSYWAIDNTNTVIQDMVRNNNATIANTSALGFVGVIKNYANLTSAALIRDDDHPILTSREGGWCGWFDIPSLGTDNVLVSSADDTSNEKFLAFRVLPTGVVDAFLNINAGSRENWVTAAGTISAGELNHICWSFDKDTGEALLWINGTTVSLTHPIATCGDCWFNNLTQTTPTFSVGGLNRTNDFITDMFVDDFRTYNTTLTDNFVGYLFNSTNHVFLGAQELLQELQVSETFETTFLELEETNLSLDIVIIGTFDNITIISIFFNDVPFNITTQVVNSTHRRSFITNSTDLLSANNSIITHKWNYFVEFTNGTDVFINTSAQNQSVFFVYFFDKIIAPDTLEGATFDITSNVTELIVDPNVVLTINHSWNNTNFTTLMFGNDFVNSITTSIIESTQTIPYQGIMLINNTATNFFRIRTSINKTMQLINFNINSKCGAPNITLLNVSILDEISWTARSTNIELQIETTEGALTGFDGQNASLYQICTDFTEFNSIIDSTIFYMGFNNSVRTDFLINVPFNNSTTHVKTLRTLFTNLSTPVQVTFKDNLENKLVNHQVIIEKYNFTTTSYIGIGGAQTDFSGIGFFNISLPNWYRFKVFTFQDGLLFTTNQSYIDSSSFIITINVSDPGNYFTNVQQFTFNVQYINSTNTFRADVNTNTLTDSTFYLLVTRYDLINGSSIECSRTSTGGTNTILCPVSTDIDVTYGVELFAEVSGINLTLFAENFDFTAWADFGSDMWFMALMVTGAMALIGSFIALELGLILAWVSLFSFSALQILKIPMESLMGLLLVFIIVIIALQKRSTI